MQIPIIKGDEYINQVRNFLIAKGFTIDDPTYPIKIHNANPGQVWVRAVHDGDRKGKLWHGGLTITLTRLAPSDWSVQRAHWTDQSLADVYLVDLPKAPPKRVMSL